MKLNFQTENHHKGNKWMTLMTNDPYDTDKVCGIYYMDENESWGFGIRVPIDEVDNMDDKNSHG